MDTKALGNDLVAIGQRLSGLQADAVQRFSSGVQGRPAGSVFLAFGLGTILGLFLGMTSMKASTDADAPGRALPPRSPRRSHPRRASPTARDPDLPSDPETKE
jgi:hypothetical protein